VEADYEITSLPVTIISMSRPTCRLSPGSAATLACQWEATAPKVGNVHPQAAFADLTYDDFLQSAVAIGPIMERAAEWGVGRAVFEAVQATRDAVGTNTNLGTVLLLAPLAAVPPQVSLADGIGDVLDGLTLDDTRLVYDAIRLAAAGGMGRVEEADVSSDTPPTLSLIAAMRLAADRDLVAREYTNNFSDVLTGVSAWIADGVARTWTLAEAIVHAHLRQMAAVPDSLIQRKCGPEIARQSQQRAAAVLASGIPGEAAYQRAVDDFDTWLRADGHRRNPGTSADMIAAGLFVLFREGRLELENA
jgi:triphosphoribosyl-dephospho-CoA synthase